MLTSKFSTTNHIIELFVALVHKPKTTSSIIKINIVANPALTPNEKFDGKTNAKNNNVSANEAQDIKR